METMQKDNLHQGSPNNYRGRKETKRLAIKSPNLRTGSAAVVTVVVMVVIVSLFAGIFFLTHKGANKNAEKAQALLEKTSDPTVSSIPVTGKEIELLLKLAESPSENSDAIYQALSLASATDNTDIELEIAKVATQEKLSSVIRIRLFQILEQRQGASTLPLLIEYFSNSKEDDLIVASIRAAQPVLTEETVPTLFKLISFADSLEVQRAAEKAIKAFAASNPEANRITPELTKAYQAARTPASKKAYLRLLGSTGGNSSKEVIQEALKSEDNSIRISAYKAMQDWPDNSMIQAMLDGLSSETDPEMQSYAFDAVVRFLGENKEMNETSRVRHWKKLVDETRNDKQKGKLIQSIGQSKKRWAIPILQFYLEDESDDVTHLSERELEGIESSS